MPVFPTPTISVHRTQRRTCEIPKVSEAVTLYKGSKIRLVYNANLSIEANQRIRNVWCSSRKYTLELYHRPSAPHELKSRMLSAEVLETMPYGCVTLSARVYHYDMLHQPVKEQSHPPPNFPSGHPNDATAELWHAVVCPNVTGRTKERIAQSKRARAGSLAIVD